MPFKNLFILSFLLPVTIFLFPYAALSDINPFNPDSKTYQACVEGCNAGSGEWKKMAMTAEYLGRSCEEACKSVDNELRDVTITAIDAETGDPLNAILQLYEDGDTIPDTRGGFSGNKTFENLKTGTYSITVSLPDLYRDETITVRVDPSEKKDYRVTIRMTKVVKTDKPGKYYAYEQACKKKRFCQNSTLYEGVTYDPLTGDCRYTETNCPKGCGPAGDRCQGSRLSILEVKFNEPQKALLLNGKSSLSLDGQAIVENPLNEQLAGVRFPIAAKVAQRTRPATFGIRVFAGILKKDGSFEVTIQSDSPVSASLPVKNVSLTVWAKDVAGSPVSVPLLSPAPEIIAIKPVGKPAAWQGAYKVYTVEAKDPDGNMDFFTVIPEGGTVRYEGLDWDGFSQKNMYLFTKANNLTSKFGWLVPETTEYLELKLTKKIYEEWSEAGKDVLVNTADDYLADGIAAKYGEKAAEKMPSFSMMENYKENTAKKAKSKSGVYQYIDEYELAKYAMKLNIKTQNLGKITGALESDYKNFSAIHDHTKTQAEKMGRADLVDNEFADYEKAFRLGSILLDGARLIDGTIDFALDMGDALGVGGGKNIPIQFKLLMHAKKAALMATVGTLQHLFEATADTFQAGRAEITSNDMQLIVAITDRDGYRDMKGILVDVQGYEALIRF